VTPREKPFHSFLLGLRRRPLSLRGGLAHVLEALAHIAKVDIDGEYTLIVGGGIARLLSFL
jgi:hypothetical protein